MSIDPLLLARLRDRGMEDSRIRHLHDTVERGSATMRDAAIHLMSDVAEGPVRHYTRDEGLTAELSLGQGLHWTGRALRLAAPRTLPATTLDALPGQPLSLVADFPGASGHVVTGASTDPAGNTWIIADAVKVDPPARDGALRRLRHRLALIADNERRSALQVVCHGGYGAAMSGAVLLVMFVLPVWAAILKDPPTGIALGLGLLAVVALVFTLPWPERWNDPRKTHLDDMRRLQEAQGW